MEDRNNLKLNLKSLPDRLTKWVGSVPSLIVHTILFVLVFVLGFLGMDWEMLMIILTTAVSLEAIYLAIFIQMSVNRTSESLAGVEEDIEEIQTGVGDIAEDVVEIAEDVGEIQTDVVDLQEDLEDIQTDLTDIQKDIDDIQGEVDEMSDDIGDMAKGDKKGEKRDLAQKELLKNIHKNMNRVKSDLERLRATKKKPVVTLSKKPAIIIKKTIKRVPSKLTKKIKFSAIAKKKKR